MFSISFCENAMECVIRLMRAPTLPRSADTALMARSILAMALRALAWLDNDTLSRSRPI